MVPGTSAELDRWRDWLSNGMFKVAEFHNWLDGMIHPEAASTQTQEATMPHILLQCFPPELLDPSEIQQSVGLAVGSVEPYLGSAAFVPADLKRWIAEAVAQGKHIVMLARGGRLHDPGRDNMVDLTKPSLVTDLLSRNYAVLMMADHTNGTLANSNIFYKLPHLEVDFAKLFKKVTMVVHHGKCAR